MSLLRLSSHLARPGSRSFSVFTAQCWASKKDLSDPFPLKYSPGIETGWYQWWKASGYFQPNTDTCKNSKPSIPKKRFSVVLPPPNVTGVLHLGHALTTTVQDTLVRYHRMRGCETVWVPGCDHAGIATQVVVERQLAAKGLTRHDLGREKFVEEVGKWKDEKGGKILGQLEELGASLDWSKDQFTMSPQFQRAVNSAFIKLMDGGLIYRGEQMVNWSPELRSAISDMEVTHVEVGERTHFDVPGYDKPVQFGVMVDIAYKVVGSEKELVVSTTRPETMLGDTGVAVHPGDERYKEFHGAKVWHPFRQCEIPVVVDEHVDPEMGTGVVKITPAHDNNDWVVGQRHGLQVISVMDEGGYMIGECTKFVGMHRFMAREAVCEELEQLGLFRGEQDHSMVVPVCGRTGDVVEPMLKPQWFMNTSKVAEMACTAVTDKDLVLDPEEYKAVWLQFLGEGRQRDWCVSRQIWWGHQVPAYSCTVPGGAQCWVAAASEEEARDKAAAKLGCAGEGLSVERDTDVLDTWFSSGLYPFAVFGWPEQTPDLERFYPLDLMETGHDILFFWVGRMVMLGIALTGKLPFSEVMLHGVICDSQGRKMSKSLGNVVDPLHLIHGASLDKLEAELVQSEDQGNISPEERELALGGLVSEFPAGIPAYGVDPLRWGLLTYDVKQQQLNLNLAVVGAASAWCNKVWQLGRFLDLAHARAGSKSLQTIPGNFNPGLMDMWILGQLATTVQLVNTNLEQRELHLATRDLRKFIYSDLCDTYVEFIKSSLSDPNNPEFLPSLLILHSCVLTSLKMLHPIMPFITEELYQRLPLLPNERRKESIMIDSFPQPTEWNGFLNEELPAFVDLALVVVTGVRALKKNYELSGKDHPQVLVCCDEVGLAQFEDVIQRLAVCGEVKFSEEFIDPKSLPFGFVEYSGDGVKVYMDVGKYLDLDKEIEKVNAKLKKIEKERVKLDKSLKGKFQYRKSPEYVAEKHSELDEVVKKLNEQMDILEKMKSKS